jgi:UDP-glucose/GDP-mannose dehydrogenase family, NAD binding domain
MLKISAFGLGYVGTVTAGCLADSEHSAIGFDVDVDQTKVASFASDASNELSLICIGVGTEPDGIQDTVLRAPCPPAPIDRMFTPSNNRE